MTTPSGLTDALDLRLLETVADRRGSWLLRVGRDGEVLALKGTNPDTLDTYDRGSLLKHEGDALRLLAGLVGDQFVDQGHLDLYGNWLLMRWLDGSTATQVAEGIRELKPESRVQGLQKLFAAIMGQYAMIHAVGVLHGDIQPSHVMLQKDSSSVLILDWGLARLPGSDNPPYRGGFVHYAAPEVATGMLAGAEVVHYDLAAEVYSLGALMYFCYTGETAVDYGPGPLTQIPFRVKLTAVADGCIRGFAPPSGDGEAHLQRVIATCLRLRPADRFQSAAAIRNALSQM